jgi:RNA polymerase-associated protein CTR9
VHFKFNVAFVQIQLAMTIHSLSETQRTSIQLQDAADGLEAAITALDDIAGSPNPPYPKHDIEQRANMARNTQRKQLERAVGSQKEYELKNKEKLAAAMEQRQADLRRREEEKRKAEEAVRERQEKIRKEREEIAARDRVLGEQRAAEELARVEAEMTTDSETGEKVKRKKKTSAAPKASAGDRESKPKGRSRRKPAASDGEESGEEEEQRPKKKQKLTRGREKPGKYKSAEIVEDSSDEDEDELERAERALERQDTPASDADEAPRDQDDDDKMEVDDNDGGDDDETEAVTRRQQANRRGRGRIVDESDEEDAGDE